jgi:uncharacterized protein
MKLLTIDIELAPNLAHVWGLFDQSVSLNQLMDSAYMLCFSAKWHGEKTVMHYSIHYDGQAEMRAAAWKLLDEAEAVCTYNGANFDEKHLNREFIQGGLGPPSPYASIDLLRTVRKQFKFASGKLDYVVQNLGLGKKVKHPGHTLWVDCMRGDEKAWKLMLKYCDGDVRITEKLYDKLLPWITAHPSVPMFEGHREGCPNCGSMKATKEGYSYTASSKFQRFRCTNPKCGKWYRGSTRLGTPEARGL